MTWQTDLLELLKTRYQSKTKLDEWAGVVAMESLSDAQDERRKNMEAESAEVRRQLWNQEPEQGEDDEVRTTVLGDITHPAPIIMPQAPQQQSQLTPLAIGALMAALGGLGGYMYATSGDKSPAPTPAEFDDATVNIGLGKIEDYITQSEGNR